MNTASLSSILILVGVTVAGCGGSDTTSPPFAEYRIVAADNSAPTAQAGDALRLSVVEMRTDGSTAALTDGAEVVWSGPPLVQALPIGSAPDASILPQPGATPAAMWVKNPDHLSPEELAGVLFVLDAGSASSSTIDVTATVTGGSAPDGHVSVKIPVAPFPAGSGSRGQAAYAANCASCHGSHGEGDTAPGLNDEPDNVAGDPGWTPQLLGISARSNMDDQGVSLDPSMPTWLTLKSAAGKLLTTQDFADIYSFLKTQSGAAPKP